MSRIQGGILNKSLSLVLALGLLFTQAPLSYAQGVDQNTLPQESALDTPTQTPDEADKKTGKKDAPAPPGETDSFLNPNPLQVPQIHTTIAEEEKIRKQGKKSEGSRDLNRYSFNRAIASLQDDLATAVIVTNLNEKNLKKLLTLNMEVGIAVLHGEVILFTSGNTTEIRVQTPVLDLLKEASLIAHTHPPASGNESGPSADDIALAVQDPLVEYVLTSGGAYSYNTSGPANGGVPSDFKKFLEQVKTARRLDRTSESRGSVKARGILNEFIYQMDLLNDELTKDEAYFRFSGTAAPNAALTAADLTLLPGNPQITPLSSSPASASIQANGFTGATIIYDTNTPGWAGGGYTFDDFGTGPIETVDLSSLTQLVLGLQGDPTQVKLEVIDASGAKDSVVLTGISSSSQQFWSIPASQLSGVNLSQIRMFYFIVEGLNLQGSLDIEIRELNPDFSLPDPSLTSGDITKVPVNSLGNRPTLGTFASGDGSSAVSEIFSQTFARLTYDGAASGSFGGVYLNYDDSATAGTVETIDFSALFPSGFIFEIDSPGASVGQAFLQLRDDTGATARIALGDIQSFGQRYKALASQFSSIDTTKISEIVLGIDGAISGGELSWNLGDWDYTGTLLPDAALTPGDITKLPLVSPTQRPTLNTFASGDGSTATADIFSQNFARLTYTGTGAGSFGGFSVNYDDAGTAPVESIDFANLYPTGFVFEVDSPGFSISNAFLQLRDATGKTSRVNIGDIANFGQRYKATASNFFGINTNQIIEVVFGVEGIATGAELSLNLGDWAFIPTTLPDGSLTQADITQLPLNSIGQRAILKTFASPDNAGTVGIDESATVTRTVFSPSFAQVTYAGNSTASFGGAYLNYDDPATAGTTETIDFSALYPSGFVFKMDSPTAAITSGFIQLKDSTGLTSRINIGDIAGFGQFYKVLASQFFGLDTTKIVEIVFVIEVTSNVNLNIDLGQWDSVSRILPDATNPSVTKLPLNSQGDRVVLNTFASGDGSTAVSQVFSQTFAQLTYTGTGANSFGGYSMSYDNPATAGTVESIDLGTLFASGFVLGLDSPSSALANAFVEIKDATGASSKVALGGITNVGQRWKLAPSLFTGVNLAQITEIVIGVEGSQSGVLSIDLGDWSYTATTLPDPTLTQGDITQLPLNGQGNRVSLNTFSGASTTVTGQTFSQNFSRLTYTGTTAGSFGGYSLSYDNAATAGTVESINFSALYPTGFVFEVDNNNTAITTAFIQVKDDLGNTDRLFIGNIANFGQRYKVLASQFFGVDMTKVTEVVFGVEGVNTGDLSINLGEWAFIPTTLPDPTLTQADITQLPLNSLGQRAILNTFASPDNVATVGVDESATVTRNVASPTFVTVTYTGASAASFGGAYINYDDPATAATTEIINFSALYPTGFVFKMDSPSAAITAGFIQLRDDTGATARINIGSIAAAGQFYKVLASQFYGIDTTKIVEIVYGIEGTLNGNLNIDLGLWDSISRILPDVTNPAITQLPLNGLGQRVQLNTFASSDGSTANANIFSQTFAQLAYTGTGANSFGGYSVGYDDPATAGTIESIDFAALYASGFVFEADSPLNAIQNAFVQIKDNTGATAKVNIGGITSVGQRWKLATALFTGVDLTKITEIVIGVEGNQTGTLSLNLGDWNYTATTLPDPTLTSADITALPLNSLGSRPNLNTFAGASTTATSQLFSQNFARLSYTGTAAGSFGGYSIGYDNPATAGTVESIDFGTLYSAGFVFEVDSPSAAITTGFLQVKDSTGATARINIGNIAGFGQRYKVLPSQLFGVDITKITEVVFGVEGIKTGQLSLNLGNWTGLVNLSPDGSLTAANITTLPNLPTALFLKTPGTHPSKMTQVSDNELDINYGALGSGEFLETLIDLGVAGQDLTGLAPIVFGLTGPAGSTVKVQVTDTDGDVAQVLLTGIDAIQRFFKLQAGDFTNNNLAFDLSKVRLIVFVIDNTNVGAGAGTLKIFTDGLRTQVQIPATSGLKLSNVTVLPSYP